MMDLFVSPRNILTVVFGSLLGLVLLSFVCVMLFKRIEEKSGKLLGLSEKNKILTFLGLGMGGILIALQALIASGQTKAMEDAVLKTERGQRQERLKNTIEHLGHDSDSVRLGGAYELFHLSEETKGLRKTVLDILCAHIRQTTGEDEYLKKHKGKPSEEIQSLSTLLFVQEYDVFKGLYVNLQGSWLKEANLGGARLQGANLGGAQLQGANLWGAQLQRVFSEFPFGLHSFVEAIGTHIDQESFLSGTIFAGGLSREDVSSFLKGLSDEAASELREGLEPHIGMPPSYELPESSGAITGAYTAEEAEQWIAEYEKAMSEVPAENDN